MNEHTGFHEYKDGRRYNPECLACLAEDRDKKRLELYLTMRQLAYALHATNIILKALDVQEVPLKEGES